MPLTLRTVEPTDVSLNRIPVKIPGQRIEELQCVANGTLANMMRQLGTLSSHGAQLFEDLNKSLEGIDRRLEALGLRSTSLQEKIQMGAGASQDGEFFWKVLSIF
jgi:WAS family protein